MTTKAQQRGSQRHEYAMQAPRGESRRLLCPGTPTWGLGRGGRFLRAREKSCTASLCIYASWKKTRLLLFFLPTRKSKGRCIGKRGKRQKVPFVEPVIDVQEAPPRSLCCTGPLVESKNSDAFPSRLFLICKKVTHVMQ